MSKRPADVIGNAVHVAKIATGEIPDDGKPVDAEARGRAQARGRARAASLSPERRREIARSAASARWGKEAQAEA